MAVKVIDDFETIQVHIDHCQQQPAAPGQCHGLLQAVGQQHTVGQASEQVKISHALKSLLVQLEHGDVRKQPHITLHLTLWTTHRGDGQQFGVNLAVFMPVPELAAPVTAACQFCIHGFVKICGMTARLEHARAAPKHLSPAVAGDQRKGFIDLDDVAFDVRDHDAFACMLEHTGRQQQFFFGLLAFGDVTEHHAQGGDAIVTRHGQRRQMNPEPFAASLGHAHITRQRLTGFKQFLTEKIKNVLVLRHDELAKWLRNQAVAHLTQQIRHGQVRLVDLALCIQRAVTHRRQVIKVKIMSPRGVGCRLGPPQFVVLQFQLFLAGLQFMQQLLHGQGHLGFLLGAEMLWHRRNVCLGELAQ